MSPRYLKTSLEYQLINSVKSSLLFADKSFVYLLNNEIVGCVSLPIERHGKALNVSRWGGICYVDAPLFKDNEKLEKKIFALIDEIALKNRVSKIMFSIDPLEKARFTYNYLQKYNYLDTSILVYVFNISQPEDWLAGCRRNHRRAIKSILQNKDFSVFYIDKNNPSYEIHEEYRRLHHKCAGRVTRPKETFDFQFEALKQGNAVLFGLKYRNKNIAYSYFEHNVNKALWASAADDPDYDKLPLYHILAYLAVQYFREKGVDYIGTGQPSSPSNQMDYYPDEKQLNISHFKTGFVGNFVENFRGVKYFSKKSLKKDIQNFLKNYQKVIPANK